MRSTIVLVAALATALPVTVASQEATVSELRDTVDRYATDRAALFRRYDVPFSPARRDRMEAYYHGWQERLAVMEFEALGLEGRVDYVLLRNELSYQLALLEREREQFTEMTPWLPFAGTIMDLAEARRRMEPVDGQHTAVTLTELARQVAGVHETVAERRGTGAPPRDRIVGRRAAMLLRELHDAFQEWHAFYAGYDPLFTWWTAEPFRQADEALGDYLDYLRGSIVGARPGEADPIIGDPIGVAGLRADLDYEMIPYSVEELIAIAEREFAWCESEYRRAARDMGYGASAAQVPIVDSRFALRAVPTITLTWGKLNAAASTATITSEIQAVRYFWEKTFWNILLSSYAVRGSILIRA